VTISAWTQPGCKNPDNDPHAEPLGDDFKNGLPGWCNTKKAGAVFLWLAFGTSFAFGCVILSYSFLQGFWSASAIYLVIQWRSNKRSGLCDSPFAPPIDHDDPEEREEGYTSIPPLRKQSINPTVPSARYDPPVETNPFSDNQYSVSPSTSYAPPSTQPMTSRPSVDAYGAFSDPTPSGFGTASPGYSSSASARIAPGGPPIIPEPDLGPRVSRTMQYADPYAAVHASVTNQQPPPNYENYTGYR